MSSNLHVPTTEEVREIFCTPMSTAEMIDPDAHYVKGEWFDRWHAAELRRAKAEAWDECFMTIERDAWIDWTVDGHPRNPYRADQIEKEATDE